MLARRLAGRLPPRWKALLWRAADRLGAWPVRVACGPARGHRLVAPLRYRRAYGGGLHEPEVVAALVHAARPGMTALDVGAHLGYYTLILARLVVPAGRVFAFEPLPEHRRRLRRTLRLNGLEQVALVEQAVGASSGPAELEEWSRASMSRIAGEVPSPYCRRRHTVPMVRLDDWARERPGLRVDLVKLDVEGGELAALDGARELLARHRPLLVVELHHRADVPYRAAELVARLQAAGYDLEVLGDAGAGAPAARLARQLESPRLRGGDVAVAHLLARPARSGRPEPKPPHGGSGRP